MDLKTKRKNIRFQADPNTLVYIKRQPGKDSGDAIDLVGLVSTESSRGFGCVLLASSGLSLGELCLVKVGELPVQYAKVVYQQQGLAGSQACGFEYVADSLQDEF